MTLPIYGGGQENGKRSGTENVASIAGMAAAAKCAVTNMQTRAKKEICLRNHVINRVLNEIPGSILNGHPQKRLPGNASFIFNNIDGTSLVVLMDTDEICISAGSACSTGSGDPSHVILATGMPTEQAFGTIRITLSAENTKEELDFAVDRLKENISILRQNYS